MLFQIAEQVSNMAVIYVVDITKVKDFNAMYELFDPCSIMFFHRNRHIQLDHGSGNNNKIIGTIIPTKQDLINIVEVVYTAARRGKGLAVSPIDYSTRYRY